MSDDKIAELLREIRDNQHTALELQRQQLEYAQKQFERAERLQERAEKLQDRSAQIMGTARKALLVVLPIIVVLIAYLSWLLFRWL